MHIQQNTIIIGVSSSIAAYKVIGLIRLLRQDRFEVCVVMTENATHMISPLEFEKVTGHKVYTTLFPKKINYKKTLKQQEVEHIRLANSASVLVIVPATANIIGKMAAGIADDLLTTAILATSTPILICPAMNTNMWNNPAVIENIDKLKKRGFIILPPESGQLACGANGVGRLPDIQIIYQKIAEIIAYKGRLKGKKIIVTAGGTAEPIDAVRVITNKSSGKMGVSIAEECYMQGAEVLLLRAKSSVMSGYPIKEELFETANELEALIKKHIKDFHLMFHVAAVSDFVPEKSIDRKIDSHKSLTLRLSPTRKILHKIKTWNRNIKLIGFKAVYKLSADDLIIEGMKKLKESNSDYIIVNDVGRAGIGFEASENEVYIICPTGLLAKIHRAPKKEVAKKILEYVFLK